MEIDQRPKAFKEAGVVGLKDFRSARSDTLIPRMLLVVDGFQNLFLDEGTAARAWQTLNRMAREGRAYGIHLVLSSQALAGLRSSTLGQRTSTFNQFGLRIALQMNAKDSKIILEALPGYPLPALPKMPDNPAGL